MVIVLALMTAACQSKEPPKVGKLAPDFQLPNLEGQAISLSDFRGKPVFVNFWATWCGPCVYEMPYIQETYDEWSDKGLVVLAINVGESASQAQEFKESHRLSFTVLLDEDEEIAERYNIRYLPSTFFIDKEGIIRLMKVGAFPSKATIEESLSKIIP